MGLVIQGKLNLVELKIDRRELSEAEEDTYEGVYGIFCQLNFDVHKKDPSSGEVSFPRLGTNVL